ncbi:hypothetical protein HHI36_017580 [Cryptolaemus montrouzieri]|uniref:Maturase K n=1 Tax=Cryptolaemus montrouzieri TaxID=559131 RepID=A0ABD2NNB2_9CUCU
MSMYYTISHRFNENSLYNISYIDARITFYSSLSSSKTSEKVFSLIFLTCGEFFLIVSKDNHYRSKIYSVQRKFNSSFCQNSAQMNEALSKMGPNFFLLLALSNICELDSITPSIFCSTEIGDSVR